MRSRVVRVDLDAGIHPFSVTFWATDKPANPSLELLWAHSSGNDEFTIEVGEGLVEGVVSGVSVDWQASFGLGSVLWSIFFWWKFR